MVNFVLPDDTTLAERAKAVRDRAKRRLAKQRRLLPKLSRKQADIIIDMMASAYNAGAGDVNVEWSFNEECRDRERSDRARASALRGVRARRAKSSRPAIRAAFESAAKNGSPVSADELARKFKVSRATVYRALSAGTRRRNRHA